MTLVSTLSNLSPLLEMEGGMPRAYTVRSSTSNLSFNMNGIKEELDEIEAVYVAVGKEVEQWRENLEWLLTSIAKHLTIVFLHVHQPAQRFKTPLGPMPAKGVEQKELNKFRMKEKQEMNENLKKYIHICTNCGFKATTLTIDNEDIAKGLLELINEYNITNLVMGAGSEWNFFFGNSNAIRDRKPRSRIARTVKEKAKSSCRIRFISKGELICIREPSQNAPDSINLSRSSSGSSGYSVQRRSQSMPPCQVDQTIGSSVLDQRSRSITVVDGSSFPIGSPSHIYYTGLERPARCSSDFSHQNLLSDVDNNSLITDSLPATPLNNSPPSFHNVTDDIYTRLKEAMDEAEKLKREAYEESSRRNKAEFDLVQATRQLKSMENMLNAEKQKRAEIEDKLTRQSNELVQHKKMYEQTKNELRKVTELMSSLESQNMQLSQIYTELQAKFEETNALLEKLKQERDIAVREAPELNRDGSTSRHSINCLKFTYSEIKDATNNFDKLRKIGEGGYGAVYRGFLRHTDVAIKILSRDSIQGDSQFYKEIEILSRIRHPHLVTLIGACLEAHVLVYQYLPLSSLDNHLNYKGHNPPLSWISRVHAALEICSALIFLHSSLVVHGDLKPENVLLENVLLDSSNMTKLSDFGICREINLTGSTRTPYHLTQQPKGTFPYMDPEYLSSGELTTQYDVFSFGIVLLQLVTGKEAKGLRNSVEVAMEQGQIRKLVDPSAGWPLEQAKKMIQIGLSCSEASRRKRPDLANDVWGRLESIRNAAGASTRRSLTRPSS